MALSDELGTVVERHVYEPYGAIVGKPAYSGIGYTGHVMDGGTGLTYMQQRYYDQSIGRFLSTDPVQANANDGAGFNRYRYAANNPYRFVDPDGRQESIVDYMKYSDPVQRKAEEEAALVTLRFLEDWIPGWGDAKGFKEAYEDPSTINILAAGAGVLGPVGDGVGKIIKQGDNLLDAGRKTTAIRQVGSVLESVHDVIANPKLLEGKSLDHVRTILRNSEGWVEGTLGKGRNTGRGWTMRQMNSRGTDYTDLYIQYHPGSRHHPEFPDGYWKVSSGSGGTTRIPAGR